MEATGIAVKMPARIENGQVVYEMRLEDPRSGPGTSPAAVRTLPISTFLGRPLRLEHRGEYACVRCGTPLKRVFGEGFCYPCFRDAPEAAECIVRPELCEAHLGRGRDVQWEEDHHNQPHAVYFARSSALKVGVTRLTQVPVRWIDQGASWAVVIARVPYRQLAGRIEVAMKELYTDRTAWQRMLKDETPADPVDLARELGRVRDLLNGSDPALAEYLVRPGEAEPLTISYPVIAPPGKVKSVNLAKTPLVESVLQGIRGQYLIFEGGAVLNVRRHSGFRLRISLPGV
ncbi:hypothetical protein AU468_06780 [Alkalispirochaeta sphaeroplastigenens]|uniref:DUF2797 domain-containing protein n=1 Tax=Alkalispirochaeta sphaeroplastigenens TaxID=1187066 RepID=A0A2S4JRX6_9SPIO|nr:MULTISPECIES: DUF2797 domain-containing protein [Alkalispirochaeta]POR02287.1 hypothetical protein AU468_06780 [Alkalispirochaeta sphaeroplastigenens]